jgi:hypothetical protein
MESNLEAAMYRLSFACVLLFFLSSAVTCYGQELPYFVTYSHHMEEPGSVEVETKTAGGQPRAGGMFFGTSTEIEYGTRAWWTSELYLDSQHTVDQSTLFTGFRLENRVHPLLREHILNPVIYVEFEDINGANKSLLEVVGHDGESGLGADNGTAGLEKLREVELKLILSSNAKGWNFSENVTGEKNLKHAPWEFGYAVAASRPLRMTASAEECRFCAETMQVGVEMYGGLGDVTSLGTHNTSHYLAPTANWEMVRGATVTLSPGFGLNDYSLPYIYRLGISYEIGQVSRFFRGAHSRRAGGTTR